MINLLESPKQNVTVCGENKNALRTFTVHLASHGNWTGDDISVLLIQTSISIPVRKNIFITNISCTQDPGSIAQSHILLTKPFKNLILPMLTLLAFVSVVLYSMPHVPILRDIQRLILFAVLYLM